MSPFKLSLFNRGDEPDEDVELDDDDLVSGSRGRWTPLPT